MPNIILDSAASGVNKDELEAAQRLEGVTTWSECPCRAPSSSDEDDHPTDSKTYSHTNSSEEAQIVFFASTSYGNTSASFHNITTQNGTWIQTYRSNEWQNYIVGDAHEIVLGGGIIRLEPGGSLSFTVSNAGHHRGTGFMKFVMTVPKSKE